MSFGSSRRARRMSIEGGWAKCFSFDKMAHYEVENISMTGLALRDGPILDANTPITIEFGWERIGHGTARGRVVHSAESIGIELVEMDTRARNLLLHLAIEDELQ